MAVESNIEFDTSALEKALERAAKKYTDKADIIVQALTRTATNKVKAETTVRTGNLKRSWRGKTPKHYKNNTVTVGQVKSEASHAHLYEYGHDIYSGGKGKVSQLNALGRKVKGVKKGGRVEGTYVLENTIQALNSQLASKAEGMLDDLISECDLS